MVWTEATDVFYFEPYLRLTVVSSDLESGPEMKEEGKISKIWTQNLLYRPVQYIAETAVAVCVALAVFEPTPKNASEDELNFSLTLNVRVYTL